MVSDFGSKVESSMDYDHLKGHLGQMFYFNDVTTSASAQTFMITTGTLPVHFLPTLYAGAQTTISINEGGTVSTQGTSTPLYNYNRTSPNTLGMTFWKGSAVTGGTVIRNNVAGSGTSPGQAISGVASAPQEYILKPNTNYLFTHTPSTSNTMVFIADIYEMAVPLS